ncbi:MULTISPECIES: enhanced intracellular survival protein Eis [unclassified Rossellomorea]|uniref:GNAT family N-acetyltransferase n=1 Tax=unclassified Rossellomorea TaxID=2837526 RepID=UPI00262A3A8C|nr:GNAT family N-acetyltransferase [uncultured Rossellomorea sp.]
MITKLNYDQFEESLQLSEYAFQYAVPSEDRERRFQQTKEHTVYGIYEEEKLAAKLHLIPLEIQMGKQVYPMGGIAGVATYPEFRRRGHIRQLMNHSLLMMKEEGKVISMLHPFYIDFYRKFGWEVFTFFHKVQLEKKDLVPLKPHNGHIKRFTKDTYPNELEVVYNRYAEDYNGMLVRSENWWRERSITDLWIAIYYNEQGDATGYLTYEVKKEKIKVEEFIPLTSDARIGLWNFICQHDSMVKEAELILNPCEALPYMLKDPAVKMEKYPYFMARIVDVENFLKKHVKEINFSYQLSLSITDSTAAWNNNTFIVNKNEVLAGGKVEDPISMDINTFSGLAFGVHTPQALIQMGKLQCGDGELHKLKALSQGKQPFFYDFF